MCNLFVASSGEVAELQTAEYPSLYCASTYGGRQMP